MIVVFRVDASDKIGLGHLMRCLALAERLMERGFQPFFISKEYSGGDFYQNITNQGIGVKLIGSSAEAFNMQADHYITKRILAGFRRKVDLLVVDHYNIDYYWEVSIKDDVNKIMVIDDLANRKHYCDLLLDQNLNKNQNRYMGLVNDDCRVLLGPQYLLLRSEFYMEREKLRTRDGGVCRLLISFGGSDSENLTEKSLSALINSKANKLQVDVVLGGAYKYRKELETKYSSCQNIKIHFNVANMAPLIHYADLAIGTGGTSMWERCFLGLPTINITIADNQIQSVNAAKDASAIYDLGWKDNVDEAALIKAINLFLDNPQLIKEMSANALETLGDSSIGTPLVVRKIIEVMGLED